MNLAARIKQIRETFGITQEQLGEILGTSIGVPKAWEQGKTKTIKPKYSLILSEKFHISKEWIETGRGDMRIDHDADLQDISLIADILHGNKSTVRIPFYEDIRASAGTGCVNEECKPSYIQLLPELLPTNSKSIDAVKVDGDSMTGSIEDGDIIFVDRNDTAPVNGKIYVVYLCEEVYVKRLFKDPNSKKLILKSDNPVYPQFEASCEDFRIIGRVVVGMNIKEL